MQELASRTGSEGSPRRYRDMKIIQEKIEKSGFLGIMIIMLAPSLVVLATYMASRPWPILHENDKIYSGRSLYV
jgi:hypothetical protein